MRTPSSRAHVLGCLALLLVAGGVVFSDQLAPPDASQTALLDLADRAFLDTRYRDAADLYRRARDHRGGGAARPAGEPGIAAALAADGAAAASITASTAASASAADSAAAAGGAAVAAARTAATAATSGAADAARLLRRASLGLGRSLLRVTRFAEAREEAMRFLAAHPNDADALTLDGESLWGLGLFPEAQQRFTEALARDPKETYAHYGLARVLAAERQFEAALAHANEAILRAPREVEPRFIRAFILDRLHQYDDAGAALRDAMTLFPPNEKSDRAVLTRSQIRFFDNFHNKVPFEVDPREADATHIVSFRLDRDKIIIRGKINGGQAIDLVLDTGAEMTVVSRRTAERNGVRPTGFTVSAGVGERGVRGLQVGRLDALQVGTYRVKHVPVLIKSPALVGMPRHEADAFSPLSLGLSMTIDYTRQQLTFGRAVQPRGEIELPLYSYRLAVVRGTINDRTPATFVVDTGGEVISISTSMARMIEPPRARRIPLKVWGTSGWDREAELWPGLDLAFDRIRFENFSTVVLNLRAPSALLGFELGGIVGHRFLSKYDVGMDLQRNRLTLTPKAPGAPRVAASPPAARPAAPPLPPPSSALRASRE